MKKKLLCSLFALGFITINISSKAIGGRLSEN